MEIFHAFGIEWKLLVIQMINFGVVLFVLYRYAYTPIMTVLAKREKLIADGVTAAEAAQREKEAIVQEKDAILLSARVEGGKIVEELRKEGGIEERKIIKEAQEKSQTLLLNAKAHAEEERAFILRESEKEVAKMAVLAAEKILRTAHTRA